MSEIYFFIIIIKEYQSSQFNFQLFQFSTECELNYFVKLISITKNLLSFSILTRFQNILKIKRKVEKDSNVKYFNYEYL